MKLFFLVCIIMPFLMLSQSKEKEDYTYEIGIVTDNDVFVPWKKTDEFFSFGIGANYNFRSDKFIKAHVLFPKKEQHFYSFEFKMEAFTPSNRDIPKEILERGLFQFDRPFAGILFGNLGLTTTYKKSFFRTSMLLGVMGKSSLAENTQDWFHNEILNEVTLQGWEFQVPNQLLINFGLTYGYDFTPKLKRFDLYAMGKTRIGNLYTDASAELAFRVGWFRNLTASITEGNQLLAPKDKALELFYKISFLGRANAFNGTAQGNLLKGDFAYKIEKLSVFDRHITQGVFLSWKHFFINAEYVFTYERVVPNSNHIFGTIAMGLRF